MKNDSNNTERWSIFWIALSFIIMVLGMSLEYNWDHSDVRQLTKAENKH